MPPLPSFFSPLYLTDLGSIFDLDRTVTGYIFGLLLVGVAVFFTAYITDRPMPSLVIGMGVASFAILINWWPLWTIILIVLGAAIALVFMSGRGGTE